LDEITALATFPAALAVTSVVAVAAAESLYSFNKPESSLPACSREGLIEAEEAGGAKAWDVAADRDRIAIEDRERCIVPIFGWIASYY